MVEEPTEEMIQAGLKEFVGGKGFREFVVDSYKAMLAAAPKKGGVV